MSAEEDRIFGSWRLICTVSEETGREYCTISQKISVDPEGQKVVMGVSVHYPPDSPVAIIDLRMAARAIPEAGIAFKVDDNESFKLKMKNCSEHTCLASGRLWKGILKQLKSGRIAQVGTDKLTQIAAIPGRNSANR